MCHRSVLTHTAMRVVVTTGSASLLQLLLTEAARFYARRAGGYGPVGIAVYTLSAPVSGV